MKNKVVNSAKLGLFVLSGLLFVILLLYMIGKNRNLLGSTFTIKAVMTNVNGLVPGNNVRFKGIDVGTVKSIEIENDSSIAVVLTIDRHVKQYIKKNAVASVGTDGLMGNKLININSGHGQGSPVEEGDIIHSVKPIETDEMLRTLNTTNKNIERISSNLYEITEKLNSSNSLWTILSDTAIAKDLKLAVTKFRIAGSNTARLTGTVNDVADRLNEGDGLAYQLFIDTTLRTDLSRSVQQLDQATRNTAQMMTDLKSAIDEVRHGGGTAGLILSDSTFREKIFKSAHNIEQGTSRFNENMEALKSNFLFRRYFRKLDRQKHPSAQTRNNEHKN
jgi:phospholipid/cholesterol/gamma-HCH transport system substrate-binding protein